jgi:hypothetical protein
MKRISNKRKEQLSEYSTIKNDMMAYDKRCVFSGSLIKAGEDFDIHHINGERENEHLIDEQFLYPCKREYHTLYHSLSYDKLIDTAWYREFLSFLKRAHYDIWEKELYKPVKTGELSLESYMNLINS